MRIIAGGGRQPWATWVWACALAGVSWQAQAQALTGHIEEDFGGIYPQSSLGIVVGVYQGALPARAQVAQLKVLLSARKSSRHLCFSAATFDGAYTASGELDAPANTAGAVPVTASGYSRFVDRVSRYAGNELAVGLVLSADCKNPVSPEFVPASYGDAPLDVLHVALNIRQTSNVQVLLTQPGRKAIEGTCQPMEGKKTAVFMQVCSFAIDLAAVTDEPAQLRVRRKAGSAAWRSEKPVSVRLYAGR